MSVAIEFKNVTKYYRKGPRFLPSLRDWFYFLFRKHSKLLGEKFAVLEHFNLTIKRGSVIGFIGPNGAGKTTILKLISKVTFPNEGQIRRNGSISGLLSLGAGFHPELTGKENIIFNGMILGLSRKEVDKRFDEIVAFSGIGIFLDTPIKFYSAGMKARLGFAVAINVEPDILLIDEVLSVGDLAFREKSMRFMKNYCRDPRHTVVFVSHSLENVREICDEVIWIEKGKIQKQGDASSVIKAYAKSQQRSYE